MAVMVARNDFVRSFYPRLRFLVPGGLKAHVLAKRSPLKVFLHRSSLLLLYSDSMRSFTEICQAPFEEYPPATNKAAGEFVAALAITLQQEQIESANIPAAALFKLDLSRLRFKGKKLNVLMFVHSPEMKQPAEARVRLIHEYKKAVDSSGPCFVIICARLAGRWCWRSKLWRRN